MNLMYVNLCAEERAGAVQRKGNEVYRDGTSDIGGRGVRRWVGKKESE